MADVPTFIGGLILEFHPHLVPKYEMYIRGIPRPPSPESPDLAEYPYNIEGVIPATWIDPIQDWRVDKEPTLVSYPQYPDKPNLPSLHITGNAKPFVESIPDDVIDGIVTETITTTKDARSNNRNDTLSIYQLNVFDGNIIACRKE